MTNTFVPLTHTQRTKIQQQRWLDEHAEGLTLCVCWHAPNAMKNYYNGHDEYWLSKELTRYFNKVDRRIFKAAHRNRGMRLRRIVTLERDDNVGWHAHALIATAPSRDDQETRQILRDEWIRHTKRFPTGGLDKYLFYGEVDRGGTLRYITKHTHNNKDDTKGFIDIRNTYIP